MSTIPLILFGLAWVGELIFPFNSIYLYALAIISMFTLLGMGWIKDFPVWSLYTIGFCFLFSLLLSTVTVPIIDLNARFGLRAYLPLALTFIFSFLIHPSMKPITNLIEIIREKKSIAFMVFYGFIPIIAWILSDEQDSLWMIPIIVLVTAIMAFGAYKLINHCTIRKNNYGTEN